MKPVWTYSIGFDISTDKRDRSTLDIRARIPIEDYTDIVEVHVLGSPVYKSHTGKEISALVSTCFDSLDPNYDKLISCSTDGAASNLGPVSGALDLIQESVKPGMYRMWYTAHQLNIMAQTLYSNLSGSESDGDFIKTLDLLTTRCIDNKNGLGLLTVPTSQS